LTSLTKAELVAIADLSLNSMSHLIRVYGPTVEAQNLMGELTHEEAGAFQLIDKILQLPEVRKFTTGCYMEKSLDNKVVSDKFKVEENGMTIDPYSNSNCRTLVPVKSSDTVDVQALAAIKQIYQTDEEVANAQAMASIKATTRGLSIEGALGVLDAFGYGNDTLHLKNQKWVACDLADEDYFPDLQGRMACETPVVWFWGGPPTKLKWYKGTLQTLLDDRVMYEITSRGAIKVAEMIGTDLEKVVECYVP
jgi:hypothetical protein